ncbi:hypothetical protein WA026_007214 [Henosepilachna vigintioctopunctata]|uniref:Uncharacterized protein n=1 Tax=Henosepilachna vigintioctopunctata TaxID=420089 RepID=A0AAW1V3K7_9CUCU
MPYKNISDSIPVGVKLPSKKQFDFWLIHLLGPPTYNRLYVMFSTSSDHVLEYTRKNSMNSFNWPFLDLERRKMKNGMTQQLDFNRNWIENRYRSHLYAELEKRAVEN